MSERLKNQKNVAAHQTSNAQENMKRLKNEEGFNEVLLSGVNLNLLSKPIKKSIGDLPPEVSN